MPVILVLNPSLQRMLKEYIIRYKATLLFILRFFAFYMVGAGLYAFYLNLSPTKLDPFSVLITEQSTAVLSWIFDDVQIVYFSDYPRADVYANGQLVYYIIEGCNALSVMILFLAFLLAFKGKGIHYLWFIPGGTLIIHLSNILRIPFLGWVVINLPEQSEAFHDLVFPAWIYGTVMLLWFLWVKWFSK